MGHVSSDAITNAGNHLLELLKEMGTIRYSEEIYDGTDEMHEKLKQDIHLDSEWYCAEMLIDCATVELERMGVVTMTILDDEEKLADGELDFTISLTRKGVESLKDATQFVFRSVDL